LSFYHQLEYVYIIHTSSQLHNQHKAHKIMYTPSHDSHNQVHDSYRFICMQCSSLTLHACSTVFLDVRVILLIDPPTSKNWIIGDILPINQPCFKWIQV